MKSAVANDPYSIGYVSVGHIDASVMPLAIDGVTPTLETVKSGLYPVARGLFSNTRGEPTGLTQAFIAFLFSETGQTIAAEKGFVAVK
jgi:phosphate transport system substrate-binding protein